MKNIRRLFANDIKRLTSNVITGIIVLGLVFLPSIFSWYNILACWDVFDNTGNLTVAVANTDEGYKSDLMPLKVNIGEQVVSALRENDQLDWTFTSQEDATNGVSSGEYYAAVLIPPSFSKDMMTFYSSDVEHAQIIYYTNEKKSAVAPKVTDQGADKISYQVNEVFAKTLTEAALGITSSLYQYTGDADTGSRIADLANHVTRLGKEVAQASSLLGQYAQIAAASQALLETSTELFSQTQASAAEVDSVATQGSQAISSVADATAAALDAFVQALQQSSQSYAALSDSIDKAFSSAEGLSDDSVATLRNQADAVDGQAEQYAVIVDQLEQLKATLSSATDKALVEVLIARLNASIELQEDLSQNLREAATEIEQGNSDVQSQYSEIKSLAQQAQQSIDDVINDYNNTLRPNAESLANEIAYSLELMNNAADKLGTAGDGLVSASAGVKERLGTAEEKLTLVSGNLDELSQRLMTLGQDMMQALSNDDIQSLRNLLNADPAALAALLAAPVKLDRQAVYPAQNFGSQMAPLYSTLALWLGSLLLVVAIKVLVSKKAREELDKPKSYQLFFGRFAIFALMSFLQTSCLALGNMLFLGVQANNPLLYLLCFWIAGLVFTFIIYSLVVAFANLGKAIAVLMLILQVTSGGGSFPLQLLPSFFQVLSPYLPATHVINAMRAAMMGVYLNDFWLEMGILLLFAIPAALIGLVLAKPCMRFMHWYTAKAEESRLVS